MKKAFTFIGKALIKCSFLFAIMGANSASYFIYHQPKLPDKVKKLRRF